MKKFYVKVFAASAAFLLSSLPAFPQNAFNLDAVKSGSIYNADLPEIAAPSPSPSPAVSGAKAVKRVKKWTIMAFVNAKNDLEGFGLGDINEMEKVGSDANISIVAEIGRMKGHSSADGNWTGTRRLFIKKDYDTSRITSPVVRDLGKTNMGDWREVIKFVKWAKGNYPAKHYMLIIWNHGSGWLEGNPVKSSGKGISYDDETGNNIDTPQMALILNSVGKIDLYASDACLMQMAEVVYEIGGGPDYIIGSEETEPGRGYSYDKFLSSLKKNPDMAALSLAKEVVSSYVSFFSGNTQSVINAKKSYLLKNYINKFAEAAMKAGDKEAIRRARDGAESYAFKSNKDLYHFLSLAKDYSSDRNVKFYAGLTMRFIKNYLVAYNERGIASYNSNGIAVYLPKKVFYEYTYGKLKWSDDTKWDELIKWQLDK